MEQLDLTIYQGKTFEQVIRWMKPPFVSKTIASMSATMPLRVVTQNAHGMPGVWEALIVGARGMLEANCPDWPPHRKSFKKATVVDDTTVEFNEVNASEYAAHVPNSGFLVFYTPVSLAGCTGRMTIRKTHAGTELLSLTTENNGIVIDDTEKTITLNISAADTASYTSETGVYDLEIVTGSGAVIGLYRGNVSLVTEETT